MLKTIAAIARQLVQEAWSTRLPWLLGGLTLAALGAGGFVGAVALTETRQTQTAVLAALLRLCAVFLVAAFAATSIAREQADKGQELLLALPVPRAAYLLGKLAGLGAVALGPALLFGALALAAAPPPAALAWSVSLLCELWIVAAFALLAALGLSSVMASLSATLAFYLLARAIAGFQMLAQERGGSAVLDLIARLLPHLDRFTRADWLVYGDAGAAQLGSVAAQTALYLPLLAALALADLYRKDV